MIMIIILILIIINEVDENIEEDGGKCKTNVSEKQTTNKEICG